MSGVRGRSGPVGNMNASKHHWRSFFRRLALRPEDIWIRGEVQRYAAALLSDKGDPSEAERHAIELASEAKACRLLIWKALAPAGFTRRSKDGLALVPAAADLPRFIGMELGALKLLRLERRAKNVQSLDDYLKSKPTVIEQAATPTTPIQPVAPATREESDDDH